MGAGRSARRIGAALGGKTARSGTRYRPFEISPAQRLPAAACRYAGVSEGRATPVGGAGRRASSSARARTPGRSFAAVGPACGVPDRTPAPGGGSAPRAQPAAAAGSGIARQGAIVEPGTSCALDEGTSVDVRGPRAGTGLPEGSRIPTRYGVRTRDSGELAGECRGPGIEAEFTIP